MEHELDPARGGRPVWVRRVVAGLVGVVLATGVVWAGTPVGAAPAISVNPSTNLTDGQAVTVTVTGVLPEPSSLSLSLIQCATGSDDISTCEPTETEEIIQFDGNGTGTATTAYTVEVIPGVCDPTQPCSLFALENPSNFGTAPPNRAFETPISFAQDSTTTSTSSSTTTSSTGPTTTSSSTTTSSTGPTTTSSSTTTSSTGPTTTSSSTTTSSTGPTTTSSSTTTSSTGPTTTSSSTTTTSSSSSTTSSSTTTTSSSSTTSSSTTTSTGPTTTSSSTTTTGPSTTSSSSSTTTTTGPGPGLRRYLALGDSVPYGHGLANPGIISQTRRGSSEVLPPDQGPASLSYPSLLAARMDLSEFRNRPTGCQLKAPAGEAPYDHLAVSGASSARHRFTGPDENCVVPEGPQAKHKTVLTEELTAARLDDHPPSVVTLHVGTDDIRYGQCLAHILRLTEPADVGRSPLLGPRARRCVTERGGRFRITRRVGHDLDNLAEDLREIIRRLRANDRDPRILLVNYYQPVPDDDARVTGATPACLSLRFSSDSRRRRMEAAAEEIHEELNDTIKSVARRAKVELVDISRLFRNHELCTRNSWLTDQPWDAGHPNAVGHCKIAGAIGKRLKLPGRPCDD